MYGNKLRICSVFEYDCYSIGFCERVRGHQSTICLKWRALRYVCGRESTWGRTRVGGA